MDRAVDSPADRGRISTDNLYYVLSALLTSNGVNLDDVVLSPSTIASIRREVELKNFASIKVGRRFSIVLLFSKYSKYFHDDKMSIHEINM